MVATANRGECLVDFEQVDLRYRKVAAGKRLRDRLTGQSVAAGLDSTKPRTARSPSAVEAQNASLRWSHGSTVRSRPQACRGDSRTLDLGVQRLRAANFSMDGVRRRVLVDREQPVRSLDRDDILLKRPSSMAGSRVRCDRKAQASILATTPAATAAFHRR